MTAQSGPRSSSGVHALLHISGSRRLAARGGVCLRSRRSRRSARRRPGPGPEAAGRSRATSTPTARPALSRTPGPRVWSAVQAFYWRRADQPVWIPRGALTPGGRGALRRSHAAAAAKASPAPLRAARLWPAPARSSSAGHGGDAQPGAAGGRPHRTPPRATPPTSRSGEPTRAVDRALAAAPRRLRRPPVLLRRRSGSDRPDEVLERRPARASSIRARWSRRSPAIAASRAAGRLAARCPRRPACGRAASGPRSRCARALAWAPATSRTARRVRPVTVDAEGLPARHGLTPDGIADARHASPRSTCPSRTASGRSS